MGYRDILQWVAVMRERPIWAVFVIVIGLIMIALVGAASEFGRQFVTEQDKSKISLEGPKRPDDWRDQPFDEWLNQQ